MAHSALTTAQSKSAMRQLRALSGLLALQFILGIILTTLVDYDPNKSSAVQTVFLVLHILAAFGLLLVSVLRLYQSIRQRFMVVHSVGILLSIIAAMIAGLIAANNGNSVAVFLMALFFLSAFGAVGYSMSAISRSLRPPSK